MAPVALQALQHGPHLVRGLAIDAVEHQFGVAENGVERRAQLVAHVGEELGFVFARLRKLTAFLLDFAEQPRVLDRQHRLVGKRFEKVDRALRKFAGLLAPDHESTDDPIGAEQRDG